MSPPPALEIPIFGPSSAARAIALGAGRIELNVEGSYPEGGLMPFLDELRSVRQAIDASSAPAIAVRVMIRSLVKPVGDATDFLHRPAELDNMRKGICAFRESGLLKAANGDGFVFGCLKPSAADGKFEVDVDAVRELVEAAGPLKCVFHRAFDEVVASSTTRSGAGWRQGLEQIVQCGFDGILTSGGPGNAPDNIETLKEVVDAANGRLEIIVGGGVRSGNITSLADVLTTPGARIAAHSSCLRPGKPDDGINEQEVADIVKQLASISEG